MKTPKRFFIYVSYGSNIKAGIVIGEEHNGKTMGEIEKLKAKKSYKAPVEYVIDLEDIEKIIMDLVERKGYTITQTKRQKYPRLKINIPILK